MNSSPRIKICGIRDVAHAQCAMQIGADAIGLVFYPNSPRHIADLDLAEKVAKEVGPFVTVVGLFVNPEDAYLEQVLSRVNLHILQFHGDEIESHCVAVGRPYVKAIRMKPELDVQSAMSQFPSASAILLDAYQPGKPGGTGQSFDWHRIPDKTARPIILAGGLTAENVAGAIRQVRPYAVDVSGGVESSTGVKSPAKMQAFVEAARS